MELAYTRVYCDKHAIAHRTSKQSTHAKHLFTYEMTADSPQQTVQIIHEICASSNLSSQ